MVRPILLLGDPALHTVCDPVQEEEVAAIREVVGDLRDTLLDYRARHGAGRAIAAPQIGVAKRLVYLHLGDRQEALLNPVLFGRSTEMVELWDDCMSFPDLLVRLRRHRTCRLIYRDLDWRVRRETLDGDLAELLQHECDHLEGVLATSRALDGSAFALRAEWERQHGRWRADLPA